MNPILPLAALAFLFSSKGKAAVPSKGKRNRAKDFLNTREKYQLDALSTMIVAKGFDGGAAVTQALNKIDERYRPIVQSQGDDPALVDDWRRQLKSDLKSKSANDLIKELIAIAAARLHKEKTA